ncbi:MAG: hypothetical protein GXP25_14500 [Planctomycetes bacterium]|nr:hypothetical protein [Planctomycetota bacterium]
MHRQRKVTTVVGVIIAVAVLVPSSSFSVETEDGPMYLTDSHGAAGVIWAMMSLAEADPKYMDCAEQTMKWLMHVKKVDDQGRVTWLLSYSAPPGHKNRAIKPPGLPLPIILFFNAYEKTKNPEYKEIALDAARYMAEAAPYRSKTKLGTAYGFAFSVGEKDPGLILGHSHGLGKYMQLFTRAYQVQPHASFVDALRGMLVNLKVNAVELGDGAIGWRAFRWKHIKDKGVIVTGYCFGQAGLIIPLMDLAKAMPELKLSDGTTPLSLGNAGLRYLIAQAKPVKKGYLWPYMRFDRKSKNPGLGSGTGGIGWAFLAGYQANRAAGNEAFAEECMKYARGAAEYTLGMIERAPKDYVFTSGGGSGGFGVCGGAGGSAWFPIKLSKELGEKDPEFVERVRKCTKRLAMMVIRSATPVGDTLTWPLSTGERKHHKIKSKQVAVNMALDYGQTGVVLELAEMGKFLHDDEILDAAKKAADFIVAHMVKTEHGWKMPRFVYLKTEEIEKDK